MLYRTWTFYLSLGSTRKANKIKTTYVYVYFYCLLRCFNTVFQRPYQHTLSSCCWLLRSRFRSHKIRLLYISIFFVYCCHKKTAVWQTSIHSQSPVKSLLRPLKNIGMASKKLSKHLQRQSFIFKWMSNFCCNMPWNETTNFACTTNSVQQFLRLAHGLLQC